MGKKRRPAMTLEEKENQMIALAVDLCEERMRNKTATAQEIIHYLKLGTVKAQRELEIIELDKELKKAQTEAIQSAKTSEELYAEALKAMRTYSGKNIEEDNYEDTDVW